MGFSDQTVERMESERAKFTGLRPVVFFGCNE